MPFYPQKLVLLCRSLDFTLLNGETGFQKDLNYFLPFLENYFCSVVPHDVVVNVLQVFQSFTLFQCSLDQSMASGRAVFPRVGQSTPSVLHCAAKETKNTLAISVVTYHLAAFDSSSYWSFSMSGTAALSGGVTSSRPWQSTVSLLSPLDFRTGHMGLSKGEGVLLISPWLSNQQVSLWMGIRESQLVQYCCQDMRQTTSAPRTLKEVKWCSVHVWGELLQCFSTLLSTGISVSQLIKGPLRIL